MITVVFSLIALGFCMQTMSVNAEQAFNIIGISLRTSNAHAFSENSIGNLWQRFFAEQISSKIPNKQDSATLALYYDFETDKDGFYTILIGHRVTDLNNVPNGMTGVSIPAQKRVIFTTPQGPVFPGIVATWQKIWKLEDEHTLHRAYGFEYELYDERSQDPQNGIAQIHISVVE